MDQHQRLRHPSDARLAAIEYANPRKRTDVSIGKRLIK
jgi:hypothetical protein